MARPGPPTRIVVAGAGSIGCYVGGLLAAAGHDVALLSRPRILAALRQHGVRVTSCDGGDVHVPADRLTLTDDPSVLAGADIVLVAVKSTDTARMATTVAAYVPDEAVIVSLQNGVGNVDVLTRRLAGQRVLGAMVPFNVLSLPDGRFNRATSGDIAIARDADDTAARLSVAGLTLRATDDIAAVQWGKLVVNLNNALNALSGLPLATQLSRRPWRQLLADQIDEAMAAIDAAGIRIVAATPVPPRWSARLLRLPDGVFTAILGRTIRIDPAARSSMWEDLQQRRPTEIDFLQGVILELAARGGTRAPLTRRIASLVKAAEAAGAGSPGLSPDAVRGAP